MSTENHSYFTCSDCPFRPSYLFLPVTWLFVHSFAWWILHYTYLIPSTPWMTSAYSLLYNPPHPQHATINGSPSSFVCFSQLCIIVFSVLIAKSRPLLPTPWMTYDHSLLWPSPQLPRTSLPYRMSRSYDPIHPFVIAHFLPSRHTTHSCSQHREWLPFIHYCAQSRLFHTRTHHFACSHFLLRRIVIDYPTSSHHGIRSLYSTPWITSVHSLLCPSPPPPPFACSYFLSTQTSLTINSVLFELFETMCMLKNDDVEIK